VAVSGSYAYVADGSSGLRVVDVSNPTNPVEVGYCNTPSIAWGVAVAGSYAYIADGDSGLRVIDVSNPGVPVERSHCNTVSRARGVAVAGNYAFVAAEMAGLRVIDISEPSNPQERGSYDTPGYANGVAVSGNYAYVADGTTGLLIIEFTGHGVNEAAFTAGTELGTSPTIITRTLIFPSAAGHDREVFARLLNINGRKVLDIYPGVNDVSLLPAGVYFISFGAGTSQYGYQRVIIGK
jgi:hypothetical protein